MAADVEFTSISAGAIVSFVITGDVFLALSADIKRSQLLLKVGAVGAPAASHDIQEARGLGIHRCPRHPVGQQSRVAIGPWCEDCELADCAGGGVDEVRVGADEKPGAIFAELEWFIQSEVGYFGQHLRLPASEKDDGDLVDVSIWRHYIIGDRCAVAADGDPHGIEHGLAKHGQISAVAIDCKDVLMAIPIGAEHDLATAV